MYCNNAAKKEAGLPAQLGRYIEESLLEEVLTTPKPGLVDHHDSGAHDDMDAAVFTASAHAITPYLLKMAYEGYCWGKDPEELFPVIRKTGIQAEKAMYRATGGVNTHKGAIFTMGIICAAAGICYAKRGVFCAEEILATSGAMVKRRMEEDFENMRKRAPATHGEWLYRKYGEKGIRGEAQMGFPIIRDVAYPFMKTLRTAGKQAMPANINVLLYIMSVLNDTNILSRSNYEELQWIKESSAAILKLGGAFTAEGYQAVIKMNEICIEKNISPGGAADILAATLLLYRMEQCKAQ